MVSEHTDQLSGSDDLRGGRTKRVGDCIVQVD